MIKIGVLSDTHGHLDKQILACFEGVDRIIHAGDVGTIDAIDSDNSELSVLFPTSEAGGNAAAAGSRVVVYGWGELDHLVPAYACTIHKSQGSEFPAIVVPLVPAHHVMLRRNLVYTAVTRGRRLVVVVGSPRALAMAVDNVGSDRRNSGLAARLRANS